MKLTTIALFATMLTTGCSKGAPDEPAKTRVATQEVVYEGAGIKMTGFFAWDQTTSLPLPGVIVVHEWWGHNDYVRERAKKLAEMGYLALAIDMYGDGKVAPDPKQAMAFMQEALADKAMAMERFAAGVNTLKAHQRFAKDGGKVAAIGYCFGGGVVLHAARAGMDLAGVASFHGTLSTETPAKPGAIKAELLVATGNADPFVPGEQVTAFKTEMADAGAKLDFVGYPDAKHGFTDPGATANGEKFKLPLAYNEAADKDSWARLDKFLMRLLKTSR